MKNPTSLASTVDAAPGKSCDALHDNVLAQQLTGRQDMRTRRDYVILALVAAAAGAVGLGLGLYYAYPVQVSSVAAAGRNELLSLSAPSGTVTTEKNPAFKGTGVTAPPGATSAGATTGDWASYNKTLTSERYSELSQINTQNVGKLKVLCSYDVKEFLSFESGLLMVQGALIGTSEFDIFSLDPATCKENWRTHESIPPSLLPGNRGAAYMDGRLFRGTQDGRVLAYDFNTGKRVWETTIADVKKGETVPAAPIAWNGLVLIGNAGGDFKGGKGRMYALDAKTGKVVWEFYLVPKTEGDPVLGPQGTSPLNTDTWEEPARHTHHWRRGLVLLLARSEQRAPIHSHRQSRPRFQHRRAGRRESLHRLDRGARRQDWRLQVSRETRAPGLARLRRLQPARHRQDGRREAGDVGCAKRRTPLRLRSRR